MQQSAAVHSAAQRGSFSTVLNLLMPTTAAEYDSA